MRVVYLDYETAWGKDYTLSKMGIEQYVRDPRFKVHMMGVAVDDNPVEVLTGNDIWVTLAQLRLGDNDVFTVIQNAKFDSMILTQRYGMKVANPICTRAMFRWVGGSRLTKESLAAQCEFFGTGQKGDFVMSMQDRTPEELTPEEWRQYVEYNRADVEQLRANFKAMLPYMTADALSFIIMSERMYCDPVLHLDKAGLEKYREEILEKQRQTRENLKHLFRFDSDEAFMKALRSKKKFCEMLESVGGIVPLKVSEKKTQTQREKMEAEGIVGDPTVWEPALAKTDIAFQELCMSEDPNISLLCNARAENNSSIELSRCETFIGVAGRGTLPVSIEPFFATTGRFSANNSADTSVKSDGANL